MENGILSHSRHARGRVPFRVDPASVWILLPFLGAVVWATMIVVATWPSCLDSTLAAGRRWLA